MAVSVRVGEKAEPSASGVGGAALLSALLFALARLVPVLMAAAMISPLPLIIQRLRHGVTSALVSAVLAAALLSATFSPGLAVGFLLVFVAPGLLIGEAMARGRGLRRGCGWAFLLISAEVGLTLLFAGAAVEAQVLDALNAMRSPQYLAEMRNVLSVEYVDDWVAQATSLYNALKIVYPAVFINLGALIVLANGAALRLYLAKRDPGWLEGGEFEGVHWPLWLVALFVASAFSVLFPPLQALAYNVLLVVAFFFGLQGLAVTSSFVRRLGGPPVLRGGLLALAVIWVPHVLALIGLFDTWADFRRWLEPPRTEER